MGWRYAGFFQRDEGQSACLSCDITLDSYQPEPGETACRPCPAGTARYVGLLDAANPASCKCKPGWCASSRRLTIKCTMRQRYASCLRAGRCVGFFQAAATFVNATVRCALALVQSNSESLRGTFGAHALPCRRAANVLRALPGFSTATLSEQLPIHCRITIAIALCRRSSRSELRGSR